MTTPPPPSRLRFHVIVVLNERAPEWVETCLTAAMAQTHPPWRVTLVDNAAQVGIVCDLKTRFPDLHLITPSGPLGIAECCDRAVASARNVHAIVLLDPSVVPALDLLEHMEHALAQNPSIGVLGCKALDGDVSTVRHAGLRLTGNALPKPIAHGELDDVRHRGVRETLAVQSGALAIRSKVWCELGGLDRRFDVPFFEQIDLCLRARAAHWGVAVTCETAVTHLDEAESDGLSGHRDHARFFEQRARFLHKHYGARHWLRHYLIEELRWLFGRASRGQRWAALRALVRERPRARRRPRADAPSALPGRGG